MFTKIGLKNFKCFESVEVAPKLITVLIGANGTGKSSIIQALVLGKQSLGHSSLVLNGNWLQLGSFEDVLRRDAPKGMEFRFSGLISRRPSDSPTHTIDQAEFDYRTNVTRDRVRSRAVELKAKFTSDLGPPLAVLSWQHSEDQPAVGHVSVGPGKVMVSISDTFVPRLQVLEYAGFTDSGRGKVGPLAEELSALLQNAYRGVFVVPAGRGVDLPQYPLGDNAATEFSNVRGSVEQAQALLTTLHYEHHLEQQVSALFEDALKVRIRTRARPGLKLALEITPVAGGLADNAVNQGYGYGPLVFVLAQLALAPSGSTICIEEPEIHLHPKAQAEVTAVMARAAKRESKQLILATHSEHILVKLLNLVAQGELGQDELAVYYFTKDDKTGIASAEELKVNADGTLEGGLKGFFEQELQEMEEFLNASKKSK